MALMQRFVGFTKKLSSSRKNILRNAFNIFKSDCRCKTGYNLRTIMLECDLDTVDTLSQSAIRRLEFQPTPENEKWRIKIIKDQLDICEGWSSDIGWSKEDLDFTLEFLTTM